MNAEYIVCAALWDMDFSKLVPFFAMDHTVRHPKFTSEYLAGQYAYYAATSKDTVNKRTFKDELKFLRELGIKFDADQALRYAVYLSGILDYQSSKLKWL